MSRDIDARTLLDQRNERPAGGPEMPRGGRSGGAAPTPVNAREGAHGVLARQLDLPSSVERQSVSFGGRTVSLRGSEVRRLALVGAFRVVDFRDLGQSSDRWHGDIEHLRQEGFVSLTPHLLDGERTALVILTSAGRALLESHRVQGTKEPQQAYYAGLGTRRQASHDAQLCRVYIAATERLQLRGARVRRVVLDYELKREYQRFLQEPNRGRTDSDGRPARSRDEVRAWAEAHGLPVVGDRVQFPDVRIEYEHADGRLDREDLELATAHYNSRQMTAKRASGFSLQRSTAGRLGGTKSRRGAPPFDPRVAEGIVR